MPPSRTKPFRSTSWQDKLVILAEQAMGLVAPVRLAEITRRLASGGEPLAETEDTISALQSFTIDLALFTAPPGRSSAVERLAKQLHPKPGGDEAKLLAGMLKARLALFELTGRGESGVVSAQDMMSGQCLRIEDDALAVLPAPTGLRFAARLVPVEGLSVVAGASVPLDDDSLDLLRPQQSRDGRGWSNPLRAAETLYRHALRHGYQAVPAFDDDEPKEFPHRPGDGPLHNLAHAWSTLPEGAAAPPEQERQARAMSVNGDHLLDALSAATLARSFHRFDLAAGYERLLALMLDTLQRRASIGQRGSIRLLEWAEAELAHSAVPPEARALFRRLKSRAAPAEDAGLDRLRARIRGLRAKTTDQGCTEEEALAAAEKVADLLDRYGLSLSELELRHQPCEGFGIDTGRKRTAPLDDLVPTIAEFCDCRSWLETAPDKLIRHVFFGLPADTAGARYLYDVIAAAIADQTALFKTRDLYAEHHSSQRASATRSFQAGMVHSIALKLHDLKRQRTAGLGGGRDLVPLKRSVVDEELEKLGMAFKSKATRAPLVLRDAYGAGREAGDEFELHHGIEYPGRR